MTLERKITLIVPVYNKEKYLNDCFSSIVRQSVDKSRLEVLLVNDGSTDGSLGICKRFAEEYPFFKVINKENGGVSSARNAGIREAQGDYIAFLDADDSLNDVALEKILETFEELRDETDVVSYHLSYHHADGRITYHKRDKWLTETGLYDLEKFPYIAQTTMNIAVKNCKSAPILFDEELKVGEDQKFVTSNLVDKGVLGYCAEAEYRYVRDGSGVASVGNNPLYAYDDMIRLFEFFLDVASSNERIALYAYALILYNVAWRLKGNNLFPMYCVGEERKKQDLRLESVLSEIPAKSYGRSPYLDRWHKAFLMKKFGIIEAGSEVRLDGKKRVTLSFPSQDYKWKTKVPTLTVLKMLQREGGFEIRFRFSCPLFIFVEGISLEAKIGGKWKALDMGPSNYDYHRCHDRTAKDYLVSLFVPFSDLELDRNVEFRAEWNKVSMSGLAISLNRNVAVLRTNSFERDEAWVFPDFRVREKGKKLVFYKMDKKYKFKQFVSMVKRDRSLLLERRKAVGRLKKFECGPIWVYADLPSSSNPGNALIQMLHDLERNDGIERYYVTSHVRSLLAKWPVLKGHVVEYGSGLFDTVCILSTVVLVSYKERFIFYPDSERLSAIGDMVRCKRIVYLQHGVLHAHLPWYLGFDRTMFDSIVVSTTFEHEVLHSSYLYPEEAIIDSGAPRLDALSACGHKLKRVAYIPSWRGYLVSGSAEERIADDDKFLASSFWRGMTQFLGAIEASGVLDRFGYEMDLKLHPNFRCYSHHFEKNFPFVNVVFGEVSESGYPIAITDFSSYVYDFIYGGSRVMYFLPDAEEFRAGLNHYRELEIPFNEAFGPYSEKAEDAVVDLERLMFEYERGVVSPYQERASNFFIHRDGENSERLYDALVSK